MPLDFGFWTSCEGQLAGSVFPFERCLYGDDRGAVFETKSKGRPAIIRVVPGTPAESIDAMQLRWRKASSLSHPALVPTIAYGETKLDDGLPCAYIVVPRADDTLADILADRPLTPAEAQDTLQTVMNALRYLETKGLAPAELRPANVMAFGDQVRISGDNLVDAQMAPPVLPAIGALVEEMLGVAGQNAASLPEPFAEIVRNCRIPDDPADPWTLARVEARLSGGSGGEPASRKIKLPWWAVAAVVVVLIGAIAFFRQPSNTKPIDPTPQAAPSPVAETVPAGAAKQKPSPTGTAGKASSTPSITLVDGVTQVLPDIPQAARNTISGRVRVNIRISVDSTGRVTQAVPVPPVNRYFSTRAVAAAQAWKFPAGSAAQDLILRFELSREQTSVSVTKVAP